MERFERGLGPDELLRCVSHGLPLFVTSAALLPEASAEVTLRAETIHGLSNGIGTASKRPYYARWKRVSFRPSSRQPFQAGMSEVVP